MTLPVDMEFIIIAAPGDASVLQPARCPVPVPGPGEVLIRVAAAGVNYPDILQRQGLYEPPAGHSPTPGLEVSGEIAAIGPDVSGFFLEEPVVALCNGGGYAEYVAVPAGQVLPAPEGRSLISSAALPETWFTIQQTLVMRAGLEAGMSVLVHGAAGGIGSAAIQMAVLHGAHAIAVVSSAEKAEYALGLGALAAIDHTSSDFVERTLEITKSAGADRIVSIAGGDMLARNMKAAARGGTIIQLAALEESRSTISLGLLLGKSLTLIGSTLRPQPSAVKAAIAQGLLHRVWPAFAEGRLSAPRVRALPLAEARFAHAAIESRQNFGKLVLLTAFGEQIGHPERLEHADNDNSIA